MNTLICPPEYNEVCDAQEREHDLLQEEEYWSGLAFGADLALSKADWLETAYANVNEFSELFPEEEEFCARVAA